MYLSGYLEVLRAVQLRQKMLAMRKSTERMTEQRKDDESREEMPQTFGQIKNEWACGITRAASVPWWALVEF